MGFIKHALIGVALYEAMKYALKKCGKDFSEGGHLASVVRQPIREEVVDIIAGARQTDQLQRLKENAASDRGGEHASSGLSGQRDFAIPDSDEDLTAGSNPEVPLTGEVSEKADPWKKSLANDELRAPDS